MSERLPWFRCFPSALLGAMAGMEADEGYIYIAVLLRIYETGGPVAETGRTLSRRTGLNDRKATSAVANLIASGKLVRLSDGRLDAPSTHDELAWQKDRQAHQSNAGKSSAAKRSNKTEKERELAQEEKTQENQQIEPTVVEVRFNHLDLDIDTTLANAKDADASLEDPSVAERDLFKRGKEVLGQSAGGMVVRLLKAKGGNIALARAVIEQASQKHSPREYVAASSRQQESQHARRDSPHASGTQTVHDVARALEQWTRDNEQSAPVLAVAGR